jgi:putative IMPACT (imprinted ancient) family translation regulator
MIVLEDILRDRGSRYAATLASVLTPADIAQVLATLRGRSKFAKASHHSWAAILTTGGPLKHDDGEAGAGALILKMLEREGLTDHVIIVTRWYGGVNLGGDRFAHIVTATRAALRALRDPLDAKPGRG